MFICEEDTRFFGKEPRKLASSLLGKLQIRPFHSYFSSFSTNSYGYYFQMSQNLISNIQILAPVQIARQTARKQKEI